MRARYALYAIVAAPIVIGIVAMPFVLLAYGVSQLFGLPLPDINIPQQQVAGLAWIWLSLLIIALGCGMWNDLK